MEATSWKFNATRESFDGSRILREAQEAGLEIFRLSFPSGKPQLWATEKYIRRIRRMGFTEISERAHPLVGAGWEAREKGMKSWDDTSGFRRITRLSRWDADFSAAHPAKIHAALLAAERETKEFSVVGVQE